MKLRSKRPLRRRLRRRRRGKKSSLKKIIKKVVNANKETKCMPSFYSSNAWKPIGPFEHTFAADIGEGDAYGNRDGMKILLLGATVILNLRQDSPLGGANAWIRILVLKRNFPSQGITELFRSTDETGNGINYATLAPDKDQILYPINKLKYGVKYDRKFRLLAAQYVDRWQADGRDFLNRKLYIRFNKRITYTEETSEAAHLRPNYHMVMFIQWDDGNESREANYDVGIYTYFKDM